RPPLRAASWRSSDLEECALEAQLLRHRLAVEVAVAERDLRALLAAEVQLDLVVLREADTTVDLLAVGHHPAGRLRAPRLRHVHGEGGVRLRLTGSDGPGGLVHDEAGAVDVRDHVSALVLDGLG